MMIKLRFYIILVISHFDIAVYFKCTKTRRNILLSESLVGAMLQTLAF